MFEAFEERMMGMLENFEIKMKENTENCKRALNGSMVSKLYLYVRVVSLRLPSESSKQHIIVS